MKRIGQFIAFILIIQLVTLFYNPAAAQKLKPAEVPADVSQTLDFQYPNVKVTSWYLDGSTYIASIKDEDGVGKVSISKDGKWLNTRYDIPSDELPSAITEYVKKNYPEFIIDVSCLEEVEAESTHYYVEVKPDGIGFEPSKLTFSEKGVLLTRKDPANFNDPTKQVAEAKPAATGKDGKPGTTAKPTTKPTTAKPATTKPAASKAETKPAAEKPASKQTASKPATTKPATTAKNTPAKPAAKPAEKEKAEKPKKEEPEKVITDEEGHVAIKTSTVPALVTKALAKKILHPEDLNWFFIDSMYVAKCTNLDKKTAVYITPKGAWTKTLTVLSEDAIPASMTKHISTYYPDYKFKDAIGETRADKQDKTAIEFYEKANVKSKLVTTVIFDKTGKLIRSIDPDYTLGTAKAESAEDQDLEKYYDKMNMTVESDDALQVPDPVLATFKLKYPRVTNVEWKENDLNYNAIFYDTRGKEICVFNQYGAMVETMTLGKPDNLSATIQDYIKKEYKGAKVVEYYTVKKTAEKMSFYKVIIQQKKAEDQTELWFNTAGKVVNM